jgi:hypothetical protein
MRIRSNASLPSYESVYIQKGAMGYFRQPVVVVLIVCLKM